MMLIEQRAEGLQPGVVGIPLETPAPGQTQLGA